MQIVAQRVRVRPLAGLRVVVDDDRVSLMAITAMVGSWGAQMRFAPSGDDALRLIMEDAPDLFLSDIYMPDMDGAVFSKPFARDELIDTILHLAKH